MRSKGLNVQWEDADESTPDLVVPLAESGRRVYQIEGARFLVQKKRAILGDVMRLGKSCTAITAARALNSRTLIVCPGIARGVWFNEPNGGELQKWWPSAEVFQCSGIKSGQGYAGPGSARQGMAQQGKVILCHYEILHAWADFLIEWHPRVVILDEGHFLQSEGAQRTKAAKKVCEKAEMVWALTGTPLTNRPRDLFAMADVIRPGGFGDFFKFGVRYCGATKKEIPTHPPKTVWDFSGASNLEELNWRLGHFMLRRTVKDVGLELPPKIRQSVWVDVPARSRVMCTSAKDMRAALDKTADGKIESAVELVRGHVTAGHKVIVFSWRRSVAEHVANEIRLEGHAAEIVHGGSSHSRREHAIKRARGTRGALAFCATIDAASTGLDLSFADVVVFAELTYTPHTLLQAEARPMKVGATGNVLIQYVLARGTTDELIANAVIRKLDTFERVIGAGGDGLAKDLAQSEEDVMRELCSAIERQKKHVENNSRRLSKRAKAT